MTNEKRTPNDPKRIKIAFDSRQNDSTGPAADPAIHFHAAALLVDLKRVPIDPRGMVVGPGIAPKTLESEVSGGHQAAVIPTSEGHALLAQSAEVPIMVNGDPLVQGERRPLAPGDTFAVGTLIAHYVASGEQQLKLPPIERETPRRLLASQNTTTIGRDPACDIVLDHPTVALQHARIVRHQNSANVEDTSGGFGIAVNGRRTNRARLAVGDTISIGPFRVVFDGLLLHQRASSGGLPVAARDVSVQIGRTVILQPTSVSLHPGELVAVIGESGAGKSTLLKALAGVSTPSGGEVLIGGEPVEQRLPEIGYVPQFDIVHGALTVGEALDFAAQLRLPADTSPSERQRLITTTAEELGLRDRLGLKVSQLSGGQRKRVAVGTELLHRPGALFLDEPTTGLDPALERRLMTLFRQLADSGQTVALATHATASLRMCDRVIVMGRGGHLLFNGSPDELLNAFSVDNFDDLYMEFDRFSHGAADPYLGEGAAPMGVAEQRLAGARPRRVIRHSWLRQTSILSHRYALLVTRDPRFLRSAFLQVPFLGLMTALLFGSDVFERKPLGIPLPTHPDETALLCFVMVTIVTWLGLLNSAREIVKEQELARREFSIGVKVHAYISSKLVVLFSLSTAQSILLVIIVFVVRPPHEGLGRIFGVAVLLAVGSWLGVLLGLITSAFSKTEDQAVGLVPLLLVPQMLFAGAIIQLSKMPDVLKPIAEITPTRWSFAEVGNAMEMTQRLADQPTHLTTTYGSFFELTPVAFFGAWVLCSGAMLIALFVRLSLPPSRAK